jgi:hypothetical protein
VPSDCVHTASPLPAASNAKRGWGGMVEALRLSFRAAPKLPQVLRSALSQLSPVQLHVNAPGEFVQVVSQPAVPSVHSSMSMQLPARSS